jgi:hypothetical protein
MWGIPETQVQRRVLAILRKYVLSVGDIIGAAQHYFGSLVVVFAGHLGPACVKHRRYWIL